MVRIHLNCDVGEDDEIESSVDFTKAAKYLSAVNIACGFHAGNPSLIAKVTERCLAENVQIGLHPSYNDRKNFGRLEANLRPEELYNDICYQLHAAAAVVRRYGGSIHHVKPHGALYNRSATDDEQCAALYQAIVDFDESVSVFGLPNTLHEVYAKTVGIAFLSEGFGDRTYQKVNKLSDRKAHGSLLSNPKDVVAQLTLLSQGKIKTIDEGLQPVSVETICIHGDNRNLTEILTVVGEHFEILKPHDIHK